jgi:hypothetical protein
MTGKRNARIANQLLVEIPDTNKPPAINQGPKKIPRRTNPATPQPPGEGHLSAIMDKMSTRGIIKIT